MTFECKKHDSCYLMNIYDNNNYYHKFSNKEMIEDEKKSTYLNDVEECQEHKNCMIKTLRYCNKITIINELKAFEIMEILIDKYNNTSNLIKILKVHIPKGNIVEKCDDFYNMLNSLTNKLYNLHKNNIIHGNITPQNIIQTIEDDYYFINFSINEKIDISYEEMITDFYALFISCLCIFFDKDTFLNIISSKKKDLEFISKMIFSNYPDVNIIKTQNQKMNSNITQEELESQKRVHNEIDTYLKKLQLALAIFLQKHMADHKDSMSTEAYSVFNKLLEKNLGMGDFGNIIDETIKGIVIKENKKNEVKKAPGKKNVVKQNNFELLPCDKATAMAKVKEIMLKPGYKEEDVCWNLKTNRFTKKENKDVKVVVYFNDDEKDENLNGKKLYFNDGYAKGDPKRTDEDNFETSEKWKKFFEVLTTIDDIPENDEESDEECEPEPIPQPKKKVERKKKKESDDEN